MPHAYTENQLVEQPAIALFGRETKGEVVLVSRLRTALERLNPTLSSEVIAAAIDELTRGNARSGLFRRLGCSGRSQAGTESVLNALSLPQRASNKR